MKRLQTYLLTLTLIFTLIANGQQSDTIVKAKAFSNTYISLPFMGTTTNGHVWAAGLNNKYDASGKALPIEMVRIDLTTNTTTYKTIDGTISSASVYWSYTFDSTGAFYLGLNSNNRKIYRFNFKDGIQFENLGNGFLNSGTLAYSLSLGRDKHVYFGGSSGSTYWSEYDPSTGNFFQHPPIDQNNDYVLSIMGDSSWVYAQVGQRNSIDLWAIRKADDYKIKLFSIPNNTRFNFGVRKDAIVLSFNTDTLSGSYLLVNGNAIKGTNSSALVAYTEVNNSPSQPKVNSYFNPTTSELTYNINEGAYHNTSINAGRMQNNIRFMFFDKTDTTGFGYVGDYYGNWYWYNGTKDTSYLLGNTGFNVYSGKQYNDSIFYFGNYPSGALLKWNKNQLWTMQQFNGNQVIDAISTTANPKVEGYFKSETEAGFHHASKMEIDTINNRIICAGDVIRIGNTCSIGTYDIKKDSIYGYDYHKIDRLSVSSIAAYGTKYIMATNNNFGGRPLLYLYNPSNNTMEDSMDLGLTAYGKIYITGDTLVGVSGTQIYKANIKTHQLVKQYTLGSPIQFSMQLHDGRIAINTTATLPTDVARFLKIDYTNAYEFNNCLYTIVNGNTIVKVKGLFKDTAITPKKSPLEIGRLPINNMPKVNLYPNPVVNSLQVTIDKPSAQNQPYTVVDQSGHILINGITPPNASLFKVNVNNLRNGMYWLVMNNKANAFVKN